jgi:hypothetical protein
MPIPDEPFIFVSYANKDAGFVHAEIKRLERQGYKIWYDEGELQPARFWADEIRNAIAACACFMVFITEDAVISGHVCDEIEQALRANKPFVGIYWDNVELPAGLQKRVRSRQTLDRYSMHKSAFEEPLRKALSEYIPVTITSTQESEVVPVIVPPSVPAPEILPRILFFGLVLFGGLSLFLAVVAVVTPNIISVRSPDDLTNNRLVGLIGGIMFMVISFGLSGAAFAVFRVYLRGRK